MALVDNGRRIDVARVRERLAGDQKIVATGTIGEVRAVIGRLNKDDENSLQVAACFNSVDVIALLKEDGFVGAENVRLASYAASFDS